MAWRKLAGIALLAALSGPAVAEKTAPEIVLLSTMVASFLGEGEWGFSALITTPSDTILFDTGFKADTVASNARLLGIDLSVAESVVLTHFHSDHTGGLLTLRRSLRAQNPKALSTVYVGRGFFEQRYRIDGEAAYSLPGQQFTESFTRAQAFREAAEAEGIRFVEIDEPTEIGAGMVLTGPIPRVHPERNVSPGFFLRSEGALVADTVPESMVLGIDTDAGWVLVSGCGHAGMVNASEALLAIHDQPIHLGVGGFHLFRADAATVDWTAARLGEMGYRKLVGAHCTGSWATHRIAAQLELPRAHTSIGAVGTRIDRNLNIVPASIE